MTPKRLSSQANGADLALRDRYADILKCSPVAMIVSNSTDESVELLNDKFISIFGYTAEDIPDVNHWWPRAYPDPVYREKVAESWRVLVEKVVRPGSGTGTMEARVRCKDGTYRDIEFHLSMLGESFLVSFVDLSDRRVAEAALRDSEERFRLAARAGRMYAYQWDAATDMIVRSEECRSVLGPDAGLRLKRSEILATMLPEDHSAFGAVMSRITPEKPNGSVAYRVRRADGSLVWLEQSFRTIFDAEQNRAGMVGMVADITLRKEAEHSLATLGGRLIEAQEQERRRIARELHDDISQRLALITIELQQIVSDEKQSAALVRERAGGALKIASELASDISSLTQQLYSPRLELLGVVPAMREFCEELQRRHGIQVHLRQEAVPAKLPRDISLCLFRVLQEALQNAVKHSGVKLFDAEVRATADEVRLSIRDQGVGFDPQAVRERGLGIPSMQERVALVGGAITIQSQLKKGTQICVRIPLPKVAVTGEPQSVPGAL